MHWITAPTWAKDTVLVDVDIVLDWRDLLLLIWRRGRMGVRVKTWVENGPIGNAESVTKVLVQRIRWPWEPNRFGVMVTDSPTTPDKESAS